MRAMLNFNEQLRDAINLHMFARVLFVTMHFICSIRDIPPQLSRRRIGLVFGLCLLGCHNRLVSFMMVLFRVYHSTLIVS